MPQKILRRSRTLADFVGVGTLQLLQLLDDNLQEQLVGRENGAETLLPDKARIGLADTVYINFYLGHQ